MTRSIQVPAKDLERMRLAVWAAGRDNAPPKVALGADALELVTKHPARLGRVTAVVRNDGAP